MRSLRTRRVAWQGATVVAFAGVALAVSPLNPLDAHAQTVTVTHHGHGPVLRPLATEDSVGPGYWDAKRRGNGRGISFVILHRNGPVQQILPPGQQPLPKWFGWTYASRATTREVCGPNQPRAVVVWAKNYTDDSSQVRCYNGKVSDLS